MYNKREPKEEIRRPKSRKGSNTRRSTSELQASRTIVTIVRASSRDRVITSRILNAAPQGKKYSTEMNKNAPRCTWRDQKVTRLGSAVL
ncbi:hypothetical protein M413DRAFT_326064 [Hebeloma cylindrosporum]|uniref:Uncharacterized protein n=1 Tax=Hebeloma cylindrosporum TaxID=76867 RepID=A0A0C3BUM1_HEBCY|nr:hypothetical protein M413DRAFT_326064 [Hebeloma cylindrosporum h7]